MEVASLLFLAEVGGCFIMRFWRALLGDLVCYNKTRMIDQGVSFSFILKITYRVKMDAVLRYVVLNVMEMSIFVSRLEFIPQ